MAPSALHTLLIHMLSQAPALLRGLCAEAGVILPEGPLRVLSAEFSAVRPVERRADIVIVCGEGDNREVLVVEIQLGVDEEKRWSWPLYLALARNQHRCPARLVVISLKATIAAWVHDVTHDSGMSLHPVVLLPEQLGVPDDDDNRPLLAERLILAAIAHRDTPDSLRIVRQAPRALLELDEATRDRYLDMLLHFLTPGARAILEALMFEDHIPSHPALVRLAMRKLAPMIQQQVEQELEQRIEERVRKAAEAQGLTIGQALGEAQGRTHALQGVLRQLLAAQGIPANDAALESADLDTLNAWVTDLVRGTVPEALRG